MATTKKKRSTAASRAKKRAAKEKKRVQETARLGLAAVLQRGDLCDMTPTELEPIPESLVGETIQEVRRRGLNLHFYRPVK